MAWPWVRPTWVGLGTTQTMGGQGSGGIAAPNGRPAGRSYTVGWHGPARECLVIQSCVCHRPIKVSAGQGLPPELAVVSHPTSRLIIPFRPNYSRLVGKQFGCLCRESGGQGCCHQWVPLHPLWNVGDWQPPWGGRAAWDLSGLGVHCHFCHLHKLEVQNPLHNLWRQNGSRIEGTHGREWLGSGPWWWPHIPRASCRSSGCE